MTAPGADAEARRFARQITAAIRATHPHIALSASARPDGTFLVRMPEATARFWGVDRDPAYAAAFLARHLPRPVRIAGVEHAPAITGNRVLISLAYSDAPRPADPGTSRGCPEYGTVDEVIGDFPATAPVRRMIQAAIDGGLRPHLAPERSPHGRRYRVCLWGTGPTPLCGCLDILEDSGRYAEAWLAWGRGDETRYGRTQAREVYAQITSARDLHRSAS